MTRKQFSMSEEWISPQEALALAGRVCRNVRDAKEFLADAMRSQKIDIYADTVWETDDGDVGGEWAPRKSPQLLFREGVEVDRTVWLESDGWPDDFEQWRWHSGEFVIFTADRHSDAPQTLFFKGVRFRRSDVIATVNPSGRAGIGGRPADKITWQAFWFALIELAQKGELASFSTQRELVDHILSEIGEDLSQRTLEPVVSQVWKRFIQGKQ